MIREILIPVRGDGKGDNVLAHGAALAKRFAAHVKVIHCHPKPEDTLPFGVPIPEFLKSQISAQVSEVAKLEEAKLYEEFQQLCSELGLTVADEPVTDTASASWTEAEGKQVDVIRRFGRLVDVIAVAKPDRDQNIGSNSLRRALFFTGRPVLMCPEANKVPEDIGGNVTLAWNGSIEATRAVNLSMPLLRSAETVTILSAGTDDPDQGADELKRFLDHRGVKSSVQSFKASRDVPDELMERSRAAGATIMIMGAYGDSHEKETLFGGNTQRIVDTANMPILMVH